MGEQAEPSAPPPLRRALGVPAFFTLALGTMIGVGWVVVMHDWLNRGGPLGAILGFGLGGLLFVPIAIVYGHLTASMPRADGEMAYTEGLFPTQARFAVGWVMTLSYLVVCPYEAVAVGQLASQIFPALESIPLYKIGKHTVYLPELALGLTLVVALTAVNVRGVGPSATLQIVFTFALLLVFAVFVALGLTRGQPDNLPPLFSTREDWWGMTVSVLLVLQIVPYFLAGFESVARCAEEKHDNFRGQHFVGITLAALGSGAIFYAAVILVVAWLGPWRELAATESATLTAFRRAFGSDLLVNFILFGAILSLIKVFNGCLLSASRLLFAMGRSGLVGAGLGSVHPNFHTPRRAILFVGVSAALGCLLGKSVLVPISEVGSFAVLVGWLATCVAYCAGVDRDRSRRQRWLLGGSGAVVAGLLIALKLLPFVEGSFTLWEHAALAAWLVLGWLLWCLRPRPRDEPGRAA
jgi:amino acid transporter